MLQEQPSIDTLVVAVGGGGMIAGVATAARALRPEVRIVGVQAERFPAMVNAIQGTQHAQGASTIAEGIAVGHPGAITRAIVAERVDELLLVDEGDLEQAVLMLLEIEKTVVEGAGAAGLAALLHHRERFAGREVGLILGGGNIEPLLLAAIIERGMVRAGRLARIRVGARDLPGVLARISAIVAEAGANIDEVHHQRAFSSLAAQGVEIELVLQTRNPAHVAQVVERLRQQGLQASSY
jgi:threonine dehydratase